MKTVLKTARIVAIVVSTVIASLALAGAVNAETVKIGVAAEPYPPFSTPDASGNWSGWEIDFMNAICADQKLDCQIVPVAWDGLIPALTSGQIDAIMSSMSHTKERAKTIDFSDKYYFGPVVIIGPKGTDLKATADSLADKILGVQTATNYQRYVEKYFPKSTVKTYQTQDEVYQDLVAGRIDATIDGQIVSGAFLKSSNGACCEVKDQVKIDPEIFGYGSSVGLRKGDSELKEKFNKGIANVRATGTYDKITKKYFDFDIYGN
ncbi:MULTISPECIES: transporter substrate-binding domain-containing protein [Sinorhizobium]|uniref:Amino acid ABC transporter n=1 Tax=Sinorhizobium americanum TaxID=194963 RepID=A0A2S3YQI2_9HYPH|nr:MULTISPECIES: transporter substrate-binding domain-containing protein [Sinorhizobium]PDT34705.1 amino acid ABC transporter [Sinorhizobium sp. FG01]PDT49502.1 amino acid ABC transporter [Sinorhizobium sp. NG07B]POH33337.1 amino acid ABC transporter [Sinorhizobium americanum]POH33511.1 amino acid ABC transporter [Sinorhizobium americanum]